MGYLWILVQIISPSSGFLYMIALSKWRYPKRTVVAVSAAYIVTVTIINFIAVRDLSYMLEGFYVMDFVYRISNIFLAAAVACILIKQPTRQTVFTILTACVCVAIVDSCAITLRVLIGHAVELLWELLLYSLMLFTVIKLRVNFLVALDHMQKNLWQLCTVPTLLMICFFLQISIPIPLERDSSNIPVALTLCGISLSVYGTLIFLFKTLHAKSELEHNTKIMRIYMSSLENQNNLIEQNAKKIALFRHDLRHISKMMLASAKSNDLEGVLELLGHLDKNVNDEIDIFTTGTFSGHKLLDIMLGFYYSLAKNANIDVEVDIRTIDYVTADKTELAVAMANAIENAIFACQKQPEGEARVIRIIGRKSGKQYFLGIENTFSGEVRFDSNTGLPISSERAHGHGIGGKSIAFFAEKYSAQLQYNTTNNWFQLRLLF